MSPPPCGGNVYAMWGFWQHKLKINNFMAWLDPLASKWVHSYLSDGSIWTPGSNKEQPPKTVQSLVICIWDWFFLWCLSIKPALPLFLMTPNLLIFVYTKVSESGTTLDSWHEIILGSCHVLRGCYNQSKTIFNITF